MPTVEDSRRLLAEFVGANRPTLLGVVKDVDKEARTCDIDDDGTLYYGVRLQATVEGDSGICLYPAKEAAALALKIEGTDDWALLSATAYDSIEIAIEELVINGGELDGLVKVKALTDQLNALENDINTLKTAFSSWVVPPAPDGGGALKTAASAWAAQQLKVTQQSDIEDTKIKH